MRVDIIGGGPAGLFLAGLLRRNGTADDVRLFERHAADASRGWGVVFPEGALDALERADPAAHAAVTAAGTSWSLVDIRYRSTRRLVNGNGFHGVPRDALLGVLRDTAADLGVSLHFGHRVHSLAEHAGADLVVGADGVHSVVRREHEEVFRPRVDHSPFRYAWFGVDRVFPYFTYIFRETRWGLFQGYCYPSGSRWSSMIVHVSQQTWERSGLASMDTHAAARLCEEIFAEDLDGGAILSDGLPWARFPNLECRTWHHGNTVLIGDAAHTAHWSIGSGTRLAIEDAIALAGELGDTTRPLAEALARFEESRRGTVARFQRASRLSAWYFENIDRYLGFEPIQFAYQLMARSWRITHGDIARRDPRFAAEFDGWFHTRATGEPTQIAPAPAFAPVRIGSLRLPNRVVTTEGASGSGLVITEPTPPVPSAPTGPASTDPEAIPPAAPESSPACIRLPLTDMPGAYHDLVKRAVAEGYAMAMLDLAESPLTELLEQPPLRPLAELAAHWPHDAPIAAALAVGAAADPATESQQAVTLVRSLAEGGVKVVLLEAPRSIAAPTPREWDARVVRVADAVRNETGVAVIVDGGTHSLDQVDTVVAAGWADLCVLRCPPEPTEQEI
ncbi:FAD-dependent monooxygenase [Salinactinospora qingdaonensis]|uniref:FAD-binding domain-containing protein n=1 Tax=Salinactinospora qingdaonensis TaxID=702744 RepID=A0ABP7FV71_9ACTN